MNFGEKKMFLGKNGKMIRLSKSCLSSLEKKSVLKVLEKEYLGMGEEVYKFEKKLSSFFKRKEKSFREIRS